MTTGIILINLGTPDKPTLGGIWRYLSVFLADKRVISLPLVVRYLLLYCCILPFRVSKIRHAYQQIWTERGSPLRFYGEELAQKLQAKLGSTYQVVLGMRYGYPSIETALQSLQGCDKLVILPLYPQYSSAATGSSIEAALQLVAKQTSIPAVTVIREFYDHPAFIQAQAALIKPFLAAHEMILFSYHGLPEQHLQAMGCHALCAGACPVAVKSSCYRANCYQTTEKLAQALALSPDRYVTSFQSRLGRTPWIQPYTDQMLTDLAARKITKLAVVCPSFVADCLETLEEIAVRAQQHWSALGGECLTLIPCLNAGDQWCDALMQIILNPTISPASE